MRWSRRSNGPSNTGVVTSYAIVATLAGAGIPAVAFAPADTVGSHDARALGHPAHGGDPSRQLPGRRTELGRRPALPRRVLLRGGPPRHHHPPGPGRPALEDAGHGHDAARRRPRPGR